LIDIAAHIAIPDVSCAPPANRRRLASSVTNKQKLLA